MTIAKDIEAQFGKEALKRPLQTGEAYALLEVIKEAHIDLRSRVDALDGGGTQKSSKPRVRVPAGYVFETKQFGGTYETTDGIHYRLKGR